jgi:DNA-binding NarL/FixJ family response regulator
VARGWGRRRYPAAYARWREAEAAHAAGDAAGAREAARAAHGTARELAAEPLRRRIEHLAGRAHIDLAGDLDAPEALPFDLTEAEHAVLRLISDGHDNVRIAQQRRVSVRTVETQIGSIYRKLGVHSRAEAIVAVHRDGRIGGAGTRPVRQREP